MKRIVICYDGTWNAVSDPATVTNVVRLGQVVKKTADDKVQQVVYYNAGVGSGGPLDRCLGGVFGVGLRNNVKRGLAFLTLNFDPQGNDEIYIFGFSRGAYKALAAYKGAVEAFIHATVALGPANLVRTCTALDALVKAGKRKDTTQKRVRSACVGAIRKDDTSQWKQVLEVEKTRIEQCTRTRGSRNPAARPFSAPTTADSDWLNEEERGSRYLIALCRLC